MVGRPAAPGGQEGHEGHKRNDEAAVDIRPMAPQVDDGEVHQQEKEQEHQELNYVVSQVLDYPVESLIPLKQYMGRIGKYLNLS